MYQDESRYAFLNDIIEVLDTLQIEYLIKDLQEYLKKESVDRWKNDK